MTHMSHVVVCLHKFDLHGVQYASQSNLASLFMFRYMHHSITQVAEREAAEAARQQLRKDAADRIYDQLRLEKEAQLRAKEEEDYLIGESQLHARHDAECHAALSVCFCPHVSSPGCQRVTVKLFCLVPLFPCVMSTLKSVQHPGVWTAQWQGCSTKHQHSMFDDFE